MEAEKCDPHTAYEDDRQSNSACCSGPFDALGDRGSRSKDLAHEFRVGEECKSPTADPDNADGELLRLRNHTAAPVTYPRFRIFAKALFRGGFGAGQAVLQKFDL